MPGPPDAGAAMDTLPVPADLATLGRRAADLARASRSPATLKAYRADLAHYAAWCARAGLPDLPADPATVGLYLAAHADTLKPATLHRRLAAVSVAHRLAGHHLDTRHPAIADVLAGIVRARGARPAQKQALAASDLKRMLRTLPQTLTGRRDRAILLLGFAACLRRSELAALTLADVEITSAGAAVTIARSKTDQAGHGLVKGVPRSRKSTCPVAALEGWLAVRPPGSGCGDSLFAVSPATVARVVKRAAAAIGLDPARFAGHSLRRGFMTAASEAGATLQDIMAQSGHRSAKVALGYVERGQIFRNRASRAVGL